MSIARMVGSSAAQTLTGLAALTVTVASIAVIEWQEHEDAKKLAAIKAALEQARGFFSNIIVPGYKSEKVISLPDFWDMKDPAKPKSMFLALENLRQMVNANGTSKPVLHAYDNAIRSALKGYFLFYEVCYWRDFGKNSDDAVTQVVLRNLMYLLSEHCTKFEGYGLDVRIMDVMIEYNEAFAAAHEERTRYLTPVNESLVMARNALLEHSKKLSLEETIEDAWTPCKQVTEGLMADITQLLTLTDLRKYTDFAKPELLAEGVVKAEFFKWFHFGTHPQRIDLVESEFKRDFMLAVQDYMSITKLEMGTPPKPPVMLSTKDQAKLEKKKKEEMLNFFKSIDNFLTRVSNQSADYDPQKPITLVPISKQTILNKRSETINNLIKLFRKMSSILKILYRAYEYANYVGPQLASTDPTVNNNDSLYVVYVLDGFNKTVKQLTKTVDTDLKNIITAFQGAMLHPEERKLYNSILNHVLTIQGEVFERINAILKDKLQQKPDEVNRQIQKEKHALLSFVHSLAVIENIHTPFEIIPPPMTASASASDSTVPEEKHFLLQTVDVEMQTDIASSDIEHHTSGNKGFFSRLLSSPKPLSVEVGTDPAEITVPPPAEEKNDTISIGVDIEIQTEIASSHIENHRAENHSFFSKLFPPRPILTDSGTHTSEIEALKPKEIKDDTPPAVDSSPQSSSVSHTTPLLDKSNQNNAEPESVPTFESIDAMLTSIKTNIENKSHPNDLKRFNAIYNALSELRYHASKLQNERLTCRHERASLLKSLVYAVAHSMNEFLKQPHTNWLSSAVRDLSQDIQEEIADAKYRSLSRMQPVGGGRFFCNTPTTIRKIHALQSRLTNLVEHFTPQQPIIDQHASKVALSKH
jgi:hypothetical protein